MLEKLAAILSIFLVAVVIGHGGVSGTCHSVNTGNAYTFSAVQRVRKCLVVDEGIDLDSPGSTLWQWRISLHFFRVN